MKRKIYQSFKLIINKYEEMPVAAKATIWFVICSTLQKSIALLTTPIFTRLLNSEEFGVYSIYLSWLQIFTIITTLRLNFGVFNKGMSKYEEDMDGYTSTMQTTTLMITTVVLVIYLLFREQINSFTELSTFITLAMFLELYLTPAVNFWMNRQRYEYKYMSVVVVTILMTLANAGIGVVAVLIAKDRGLARILSCVIVNGCFGLGIFLWNLYKGKRFFVKEYAMFAIIFNLPLLPHYFSTYILEQSDRIMIQKLVSFEKAGIYSVAYSAGTVMKIVTNNLTNAIIPWEYKQLKSGNSQRIRKVMNLLQIMVAGTLIIFMALAPEIMRILASPEYYEAVYIIPPVAASMYFIFLYSVCSNAEFYFDANKFTMYLSMVGAVLNLGLNYLLIPRFGYIAAGYTTLLCYIIFTLAHFLYVNHLTSKNSMEPIFSMEGTMTISTILLVFVVIFSLIYKYVLIRYAIILILILIGIYKRKELIRAYKQNLGSN